jgi:hypothetical protein
MSALLEALVQAEVRKDFEEVGRLALDPDLPDAGIEYCMLWGVADVWRREGIDIFCLNNPVGAYAGYRTHLRSNARTRPTTLATRLLFEQVWDSKIANTTQGLTIDDKERCLAAWSVDNVEVRRIFLEGVCAVEFLLYGTSFEVSYGRRLLSLQRMKPLTHTEATVANCVKRDFDIANHLNEVVHGRPLQISWWACAVEKMRPLQMTTYGEVLDQVLDTLLAAWPAQRVLDAIT